MSVILLAMCELFTISIAWYFLLHLNVYNGPYIQDIVASPSLRLAALAGLAMALTGLYHKKVFSDYRILATHIIITLIFLCPVALVGALYWENSLDPQISLWKFYPKVALSWLVCIVFTRAVFLALADFNLFKARVIVYGDGRNAAKILNLAAATRGTNFLPVGYLSSNAQSTSALCGSAEIYASDPDAIVRVAQKLKATEVIVAADDRRGLPVRQLLRCRLAGIRVTDYLDFIERETKAVELDALQPGWLVFSDGFRGCGLTKITKRLLDIVLSLVLLIFTLPLMLLTALCIRLEGSGPLIYRQERVGFGGLTFVLMKFRSMCVDAEAGGTAIWAATKDPRVTRVGAVIRKLRIDELPQLLNVLRGDMSFVGPRPERPCFVEGFVQQIPFYAERHCVKPGITGWAQINYPYGASLEDARHKLAYDLYYAKNHSCFLDLLIVAQTIRVILWADGAR